MNINNYTALPDGRFVQMVEHFGGVWTSRRELVALGLRTPVLYQDSDYRHTGKMWRVDLEGPQFMCSVWATFRTAAEARKACVQLLGVQPARAMEYDR